MAELARRRAIRLLLAGLVLTGAAGVGCGRKMLPIRPGSYPPPAVKALSYAWGEEGTLVLSWEAPSPASEAESPAAEFRVLRARLTPEEEGCRGCPVRFEAAGQVRADARGENGRFRFLDRPRPGFVYRYKVIAISAEGLVSKESAVVQVRP